MNQEQQNNLIKRIIKECDMAPYAITMSFFLDSTLKELGDDIFYNKNIAYYNVSLEKTLIRHQNKVENAFRVTLNKLTAIVMGTSNITRPNSKKKHPLTFYEFHICKRDERKDAVYERPSSINISPLHIHGTMLVPRLVESNLQPFLGENTVHKFTKRGQGSKISRCDSNLDQWLKYVSRDFLAPLSKETMHPALFANNPDGYLDFLTDNVGHRLGWRN